MPLTVSILSYKGQPPPEPKFVVFDENGGSVGRVAENLLVLHDPVEMLVSRKHALISFENGCYFLTDNSTNGTLICNKDQLVHQGTVALADGDRLRIGDYELQVGITGSEGFGGTGEPPIFEDPGAPRFPISPKDSSSYPQDDSGLIPEDWDITRFIKSETSTKSPEHPADTGFSNTGEIRPQSAIDVYQPTPQVSFPSRDPGAPLEQGSAEIPEGWNIEAEMGGRNGTSGSASEALRASKSNEETGTLSPRAASLGIPDDSSSTENRQASGNQGAASIPEDFNVGDLIGGLNATNGSASKAVEGPKETGGNGLREPPDAGIDAQGVSPSLPSAQTPEQGGAAAIPGDFSVDDPIAGQGESGSWDSGGSPSPDLDKVIPGDSKAQVKVEGGGIGPEGSKAVQLRQSTPSGSSELYERFLEGAGIRDKSFIKAEEIPELMHTIGRVFREMIHGIMTILRGRSESKSQLRLLVTMLGGANNNPLKFMPTVDDALRLLLVSKQPGYMDAYNAVCEGFRDIMNHDLAMKAGVQAALIEALKRFDPEEFEKLYQEGIVMQRKTKCWNAYAQSYRRIFEDVLENFLGQSFIQTYEEQMSKLSVSQRNERDEERGIADA